jgi:hypothetical protein
LSAGGLHQAAPGDLRFEIFTPLFESYAITIPAFHTKGDPRTFTITAKNQNEKVWKKRKEIICVILVLLNDDFFYLLFIYLFILFFFS